MNGINRNNQQYIDDIIQEKRKNLRSERLDMSFGELLSLYEVGDLIIDPDYQRLFRWSQKKQTLFIESILLGIPIPPIFVAEDNEGKWEIIDGLQRISTILSFFGVLEKNQEKNNLILTEGDILGKSLEGYVLKSEKILQNSRNKNIPLKDVTVRMQVGIKRAVCRVEIMGSDNHELRYELFKRLNTGGILLSDQEIRNCIFRSYPVNFNDVLKELALYGNFIDLLDITIEKKEQMFLEELVLKYFACKYMDVQNNKNNDIIVSGSESLTDFMKDVSDNKIRFDFVQEKQIFKDLIDFLVKNDGRKIFRPNGSLAVHRFESLAYAFSKSFKVIAGHEDKMRQAIVQFNDDKIYKDIDSKSFSTNRMVLRFQRALEIFRSV